MDTVRAALGQPFEVTVMESASTGYVWERSEDSSSAVQACLKPAPSVRPDDVRADMTVGARQPRALCFQGARRGEHRLILVLRRPWMVEGAPADTREILVQID